MNSNKMKECLILDGHNNESNIDRQKISFKDH
jgi:hypothetical protein